MRKESVTSSVISVTILAVIILATAFYIDSKKWIGAIFLALGILHIFVLKIFGKQARSVLPDILFGIIDNGLLVVGALIGAEFAGIFGAIVGGAAMNAITDGYAGIFEGWSAEYLRKHHVREKRTALSSALGKMAGCFFGAGIVLIIAWTILSL